MAWYLYVQYVIITPFTFVPLIILVSLPNYSRLIIAKNIFLYFNKEVQLFFMMYTDNNTFYRKNMIKILNL